MSSATFIFKAIDKIYDGQQNPKSITKLGEEFCTIEKDIKVGEHAMCAIDTYRPKKTDGKKLPVIVVIHGGGFVAGDKKYRRAQSMWFCMNTGAFVASINYGLGPDVKFPDVERHLVSAVNYIGAHAEEWNLDLERMLVTGDSAGGWAAAQLCALQESDAIAQKIGAKMNYKFGAAVFDCGIYDIEKALSQKVLFNLTGAICLDFAGVDVKDVKNWEYIDVVGSSNYVTDKWPATFVIYAEQDFFCGGQGETLVKRLDELGVHEEHYGSTAFGDNHTFPLTWKSKAAKECNAQMLDFVKRYFAGQISQKVDDKAKK